MEADPDKEIFDDVRKMSQLRRQKFKL